MIIAAAVIVIALAGLGVWLYFRARGADSGGGARTAATGSGKSSGVSGTAAADLFRVELANSEVTERLWRLAFAAPAEQEALSPEHVRISDAVRARLRADKLDPKYFPRRPTLMPQLLRAVDDPGAATEKLSRMIAHDPVLTADVLRLANSAMYRTSPAPIETIQRAIVVLGVDALRGLIATAMLQPVFRATRSNFPRFPRMLWERTERASRAAEMYALKSMPQDRFEAQMSVLMNALGPLVVYGAALDAYATRPTLQPNASLCASLTAALGPQVSVRIASHWESSPRLIAAVERSPEESLAMALCAGELLGSLSLLATQQLIEPDEALAAAKEAGLAESIVAPIWARLIAQ